MFPAVILKCFLLCVQHVVPHPKKKEKKRALEIPWTYLIGSIFKQPVLKAEINSTILIWSVITFDQMLKWILCFESSILFIDKKIKIMFTSAKFLILNYILKSHLNTQFCTCLETRTAFWKVNLLMFKKFLSAKQFFGCLKFII